MAEDKKRGPSEAGQGATLGRENKKQKTDVMDDHRHQSTYNSNPTDHELATPSGAEKRKDGKLRDTKSPQLSNWLDEIPKQEPWTSVGYYARDSQKGSK